MDETEKVLLQLTSRALFGTHTDFDPLTVDWSALYRESALQAQTILIWDTLTDEERSDIPDDVSSKWEQSMVWHIMKNEQLLYEQRRVIHILDAAGIPCAILKGSSSATCYPNPSLRIMGDIDILVKPEQQKAAIEALQANGYGETQMENHHCHIVVSKGSITVEVHKEPNGLDLNGNPGIQKKLDEFFADAVDRAEVVDGLPFLADEHQAVVLILHKLKHFLHAALGLRQLCDWAAFVNQKMDHKLWVRLKPRLEEFGLLTFTGIMTRTCIDYLGLPNASWAMEFDRELSDEVMTQILESGNYGSKGGLYGITYFTNFYSSSRLSSLVKTTFHRCKVHWPVCARYPVLMPIAPFVAYAKYLKLRKEGKREAIKPISLYKKAGVRRRLYKELKPFVVGRIEEGSDNQDGFV